MLHRDVHSRVINRSFTLLSPMFRYGLGFLLLLGCCCISSQAAEDPQQKIRATSEQVLNALQMEGAGLTQDPERLYAWVDRILVTHMDFERMSRWVLGKYWRSASAAQRQAFVKEFRGLLVRTYATALAGYKGQQIVYLPVREQIDDQDVLVRTEIQQPAGPAIAVDYSLYTSDGQWWVYDVQIDGISLVANYRATFSAQVRSLGLDGLIASLSQRNHQAFHGP